MAPANQEKYNESQPALWQPVQSSSEESVANGDPPGKRGLGRDIPDVHQLTMSQLNSSKLHQTEGNSTEQVSIHRK